MQRRISPVALAVEGDPTGSHCDVARQETAATEGPPQPAGPDGPTLIRRQAGPKSSLPAGLLRLSYPLAFRRFAQYAFIRLPIAAFSAAVHWWRFLALAVGRGVTLAFGIGFDFDLS